MSCETAVRVANLGKCYHIYDSPRDRLKQAVVPRLCRMTRPLAERFGARRDTSPPQYYREFWALRNVSFEVRKGETLGIIGRNGSGKSTLLQLICGTLSPDHGSIETRGRVAALLELGAGFNPEFTGRENVYLNASILGLSKDQIDARYDEVVAFADIGEFIDQPVKTYSSGMFVRLAFAVVAHVDADILVIDEALSVGDVFFTQKCMRFLRRFQEHGTVLFVSHDTAAVVNLCHQSLWIENGEVKAIGSSKTVTELYLQAGYEAEQGPSAGYRPEAVADVPGGVEELRHAAATSQRVSSGEPLPVGAACRRDARESRLQAAPTGGTGPTGVTGEFPDEHQPAAGSERTGSKVNPLGGLVAEHAFGTRGVAITGSRLQDRHGQPVYAVHGGEEVVLVVEGIARQRVDRAIAGFCVKDRLGQFLFGDNTCVAYAGSPRRLNPGQRITARFAFTMPTLTAGDYTVTVAIGEGTQEAHIIHHWIHEAIAFKSHAYVLSGLIGIPMTAVELDSTDP